MTDMRKIINLLEGDDDYDNRVKEIIRDIKNSEMYSIFNLKNKQIDVYNGKVSIYIPSKDFGDWDIEDLEEEFKLPKNLGLRFDMISLSSARGGSLTIMYTITR